MRHFTIVWTEEGRLRFRFLPKEHGFLHDRAERKSYAIVKDTIPTNWLGKWSRVYLVSEAHAQTVTLEGPAATDPAPDAGGHPAAAPQPARADGYTVEIAPPLNMVAKVTLPQLSGRPGTEAQLQLTAESIFDRTQSAQVRRLGNRRIQWFHAVLFVSLGAFIALGLVALILVLGGGGDDDWPPQPLDVKPGATPTVPQSGAANQPAVLVTRQGGHLFRGGARGGGRRRVARPRTPCSVRYQTISASSPALA